MLQEEKRRLLADVFEASDAVNVEQLNSVAAAFGAFAALLLMMLMSEAAGDGVRARGWQLPAALIQVPVATRSTTHSLSVPQAWASSS